MIELSISMSAGSTLMVLAIGLVHQSMSLASVGHQRSDQQRTFNRLASEFRYDVHRAVQCTVESPGKIELMLSSNHVVTYQTQANGVTRQQPLDGGRSRREVFELGDNSTAVFESIDQPTRAVLTVVHKLRGAIEEPIVDRRIAAVVGRLTLHENGDVSP